MKTITITIEGVTPLICNRFTDEAAMKATSGKGGVFSGDKGSPREQAEKKLYLDLDGRFCIPQPNVMACVIAAGKFHKAGKSKVTTMKSSLIPACVSFEGITYAIAHKDPWTVDERPVRNPATGGRFLCYRPRFDDWRLTFIVELDTEFMSVSGFRAIVDDAGKRIGLGDFRPDCKGPYGKFKVIYWDVSDPAALAAE